MQVLYMHAFIQIRIVLANGTVSVYNKIQFQTYPTTNCKKNLWHNFPSIIFASWILASGTLMLPYVNGIVFHNELYKIQSILLYEWGGWITRFFLQRGILVLNSKYQVFGHAFTDESWVSNFWKDGSLGSLKALLCS